MKCPKCGAENPDGSMFCQSCGMMLQEQSTNAKSNNTPWIICGIAILAAVVMTIVSITYIQKYDNECIYRWDLESRYQYNYNLSGTYIY